MGDKIDYPTWIRRLKSWERNSNKFGSCCPLIDYGYLMIVKFIIFEKMIEMEKRSNAKKI